MKLDLGSGSKAKDGYVGVDRLPVGGVRVVCDFGQGLPFREGTAEAVRLEEVIEHVVDVEFLVREILRVCVAGALVTIRTPHYSALASWRDPTHLHHLSYFSMDRFARETNRLSQGGLLHVRERQLRFGGGPINLIGRLIFHLSPRTWESRYAFVFRASGMKFVLEVEK